MTTTINILKVATCGKVTSPEQATLTYNVGYDTADKTLLLRVTDNATSGLFSTEWIALADILATIEQRTKPNDSFNARLFASLFSSASANNSGFLAAALKAEGILVPFKDSKRLHYLGDVKSFESTMQKLIKDKVSLPDVVAERGAAKAKLRAENEKQLAAKRAKNAPAK
ncbi:hypothetical protein [Glaciecola sp. SC05]|uniref:hypothetical protein n=1 Tax=Glaciecola sp. SC05 TaxID=1987355 RepID=UPI003527D22C